MLQKFSGSMSCPSSPLSSKTGLSPNHLPFGYPHPLPQTILHRHTYCGNKKDDHGVCLLQKRVDERDLLIAFFLRRDEIESSHKCFGQRRHVCQAPPDVREQKKERSAPQWRLGRETNQVSGAFTTVSPRSAARARARPPVLQAAAWKARPGTSHSRCTACSAGRRVRPLEPSRWSQQRSTLHRLVTQRASGRLWPASLRPGPPARGFHQDDRRPTSHC